MSVAGVEYFTVMFDHPSLVPRPSASRARIAYVTFEPLSDSCQLSDKGSKVTYAMRARLADGLGTRLQSSFLFPYFLPFWYPYILLQRLNYYQPDTTSASQRRE